MSETTAARICGFCGRPGEPDTRYAAGLGTLIDERCITFFNEAMSSGPRVDGAPLQRHELDDLADDDLLAMLPQISATAGQVNSFLAEWVKVLRARKMSWTVIGNALGISRQAAWERFTRVIGTEKDPGVR